MNFGAGGFIAPGTMAGIGGVAAPALNLLSNVEKRVQGTWAVRGGELVPLVGKAAVLRVGARATSNRSTAKFSPFL